MAFGNECIALVVIISKENGAIEAYYPNNPLQVHECSKVPWCSYVLSPVTQRAAHARPHTAGTTARIGIVSTLIPITRSTILH